MESMCTKCDSIQQDMATNHQFPYRTCVIIMPCGYCFELWTSDSGCTAPRRLLDRGPRVFHGFAKNKLYIVSKPQRFEAEVWADSYSHLLAIREVSQHSKCSTCTRHKALLKRLSGDRVRHQCQMAQFGQHLALQYADRVEYWKARSESRMKEILSDGLLHVSAIADGMDHGKYAVPRHTIFSSKEFQGFQRPVLDATAIICHGYSVSIYLSQPITSKDSSFSFEAIMHTLDQLAAGGIDLRRVCLQLQADNTTREVKNNTTIRGMGALVAAHRVHTVRVCHLMSGHSHEDIDQFFSSLTTVLSSNPHLETPEAFKQVLEDCLKDPTVRPWEPRRSVHIISHVRNWKLGYWFLEVLALIFLADKFTE